MQISTWNADSLITSTTKHFTSLFVEFERRAWAYIGFRLPQKKKNAIWRQERCKVRNSYILVCYCCINFTLQLNCCLMVNIIIFRLVFTVTVFVDICSNVDMYMVTIIFYIWARSRLNISYFRSWSHLNVSSYFGSRSRLKSKRLHVFTIISFHIIITNGNFWSNMIINIFFSSLVVTEIFWKIYRLL